VLETGEHRRGRQQSAPRGGELDGERQAVEARHDLGHGPGVRVVELEIRPNGAGPVHEQADRFVAGDRVRPGRAGVSVCRGQLQRRDGVFLLAADPQRDPA
jgi:hypothetical protein